MKQIRNIEDYISGFPQEVRKKLEQVRTTIQKAAPDASERISYQIPTFFLNGNLVHFAAYKTHIGFYPAPSGIKEFMEEISKYKWAKGSVQFPIDEEIPVDLITRIVAFRVKENLKKLNFKSLKRNKFS